MSVEFCPDFCQTSLEEVCEALVDATVAILSDVNSLSKRDLTVTAMFSRLPPMLLLMSDEQG